MTRYWELYLFIGVGAIWLAWTAMEVTAAWYTRWRKWKAVKPHYGSVYDASVRGDRARPNIDLRRMR